MKRFTTTLATHLRGFQIPRGVVRLVCEAVKSFDNYQVATALDALPALRDKLNAISDAHSYLSVKQRLAIRAAYKVIKFDDSQVTEELLIKDLSAMSEPSPTNCSSQFSWVKLGVETLAVRPYLNKIGDPEDLVYKTYQKALRTNTGEPDALILKWAKQYSKGISVYASLPEDVRCYNGWRHVFGGELPNCEETVPSGAFGHVGVTFEQGMKVRLFASPNLIFQSYLEPLKRSLQTICRSIPEDYHGDQAEGRRKIQQKLREGVEVVCYDLSSATHRFPWELQLRMLKMFETRQDYVHIADFVSRMPYSSKWGPMRWVAGQPLGTGPSFFTFSLCHHLLIRGIFHRLGEDFKDGYALLGDDVAIFNKRVAKVYRKVMTAIGCFINLSKSTSSSEVGEFAGSYIDKNQIVNLGKYRKISHRNEFNYLSLWDEAPAHLTDVRHYLKGDVADELMNQYVQLSVIDKSNLILKTDCYRYPSNQVAKLNLALSGLGVEHQLNAAVYDDRVRSFADKILKIFYDCEECYPDAVAPHLLSKNMIAMVGLIELVQFGLKDSLETAGVFTPIWWYDYCQITGTNHNTYSNYKAVRETNRYLMGLFFVTSQGSNSVSNRYNREVKRACKQYRILEADKGIVGILGEINKLAKKHNHTAFLTASAASA